MSNKILDTINEVKNACGNYTDLKTYIEAKTGQQTKDWDSNIIYNPNQIVIRDNFFYKCIAASASTKGTFVTGEWQAIGNSAGSLTTDQMSSINSVPTLNTTINNHMSNVNNPHSVNITQLKDTNITTPNDKQVLGYDAGTSKWINQTVSMADEKVKASASGTSGYMDSIVDGTTCVIDNNKLIIKTLSGLTVDVVNLNTLANMTANVKDTFANYIPIANISESLTSTSTSTVPSSNTIKTLSETIGTNYVAKSSITDAYDNADKTLVASQYALHQLALLIGALQGGLIWKGGINGTDFKALTSWQAGYLYKATEAFEVGTTSISNNALIVFKDTVTSGGVVTSADFDVFVSATEFSHTGLEIDEATTMVLDSDFTKLGWVDIDTCDFSFDSNRTVHIKPKSPATATHLYINGNKIILDSEITVQIPNISGTYYVTMSAAKVLSYGTSIDYNDYTQMPICFIRFDTTNGIRALVDLRVYNLLMDAPTRAYLYNNGIQWQSGFEMQNFAQNISGTPNALCQFSLTDGQIRQSEKLINYKGVTTPANSYENILSPFTAKLYYILGNTYTNDEANNICLKKATTRPYYNKLDSVTGNFGLQEMDNDKYFAVLIGVSTDVRAGQSAIAIMGQHMYNSVEECKTQENFSTISLADFNLKNVRFLYGIVFHCNDSLYINDYHAKAVGYLDVREYITNKSLADSQGTSTGSSAALKEVDLTTSTVISADKNTVYYIKTGSNGATLVLPTGSSQQDKIRISDINGLLGDIFTITVNGELATINSEACDLTLDVAFSTVEFEWTGSTWLIKFYGNMTTPQLTNKLLLPVSTLNMASIKFQTGDDPISPYDGDLWLSNYDNQLKFRDINNNNISLDGIVGEIKMYVGTTAPIGYLLCNGQILSKTQYQRLYNVIGNNYWDGTTTLTSSQFQLPNFNGRVPVGLNSTDTDFATLGKTGGEKKHQLTIAEMPSHNHTYTRPTFDQNSGGGSSTRANTSGDVTGSTGGNQAHNNLQPYIVLNYIVKY